MASKGLARLGGGEIVEAHDAIAWERGFKRAMDAAWRVGASQQARAVAPQLSVDAMAYRVSAALLQRPDVLERE